MQNTPHHQLSVKPLRAMLVVERAISIVKKNSVVWNSYFVIVVQNIIILLCFLLKIQGGISEISFLETLCEERGGGWGKELLKNWDGLRELRGCGTFCLIILCKNIRWTREQPTFAVGANICWTTVHIESRWNPEFGAFFRSNDLCIFLWEYFKAEIFKHR